MTSAGLGMCSGFSSSSWSISVSRRSTRYADGDWRYVFHFVFDPLSLSLSLPHSLTQLPHTYPQTDLISDAQVASFVLLFFLARRTSYGSAPPTTAATPPTFSSRPSPEPLFSRPYAWSPAYPPPDASDFARAARSHHQRPRNWIERPLRTVVEIFLWMLSFVCAYAIMGDVLGSLVVGAASGVEYCCLMVQLEDSTRRRTLELSSKKSSSSRRHTSHHHHHHHHHTQKRRPLRTAARGDPRLLRLSRQRYRRRLHVLRGEHCVTHGLAHFVPIAWISCTPTQSRTRDSSNDGASREGQAPYSAPPPRPFSNGNDRTCARSRRSFSGCTSPRSRTLESRRIRSSRSSSER